MPTRPNLTRSTGPSRRQALRLGVLSAFGVGLGDLWRARASAAEHGSPRISARASSCILIWQAGGPSHLDTFDPKPEASSDIRGEFKPIETSVAGVRISEVYPNLARILDKAVLVRSMTSPEAEHDRASHHLMTGYRPSPALVYPSLGSVVAKVHEKDAGSALPPYVAVPTAPAFASSGYLTPAYDPFSVGGDPNASGFRVRDLTPPDRLTLDRLQRRRSMVQALDAFSAELGETPLTEARDEFSGQAYELLTSGAAQRAFQLEEEPDLTRDRYGRTTTGQSCLLARRLVERGVPFVTVNDGSGALGWDTHVNNFPTIRNNLAPGIDQGVSALLEDLEARGLLETTLVLMMGEFGRTPKINGNAGRDHHGRANSVLMAGGGLPRGVVIGRSDAQGDNPSDRPVTPSDLAATVFTLLGIDPAQRFPTSDGQPIRLVDTGEAMRELM